LGHDDLILITEYNPAIEKHKTGETIIGVFKQILSDWLEKHPKP